MNQLFDIKSNTKEITLNGLKLTLEYDYRAYAMIEEATEKSIYEIKDDFLDGKITLKNQVIVLYCGLLRHQGDFSMNEIKNHPNIGHFLNECLASMLEAFFTPLLPPNSSD